MFSGEIKTVGELKKLIKDLPDNYSLLVSVDPTDNETPESEFDHRYQKTSIPSLSVQDGRLIFHLYDMDKNF